MPCGLRNSWKGRRHEGSGPTSPPLTSMVIVMVGTVRSKVPSLGGRVWSLTHLLLCGESQVLFHKSHSGKRLLLEECRVRLFCWRFESSQPILAGMEKVLWVSRCSSKKDTVLQGYYYCLHSGITILMD